MGAQCIFSGIDQTAGSPYGYCMVKETIIGGLDESPEDEPDRDLRPSSIHDMVGQRDVFERLMIAVDAAKKRGDSLGHIMFDGPPGLGENDICTLPA